MSANHGAAQDFEATVQVNASPVAVFDALTSTSALSQWWTQASGDGSTGGELTFFMHDPNVVVVHVDGAVSPRSVEWTVTECDFLTDWVGTQPTFVISSTSDAQCELTFRHRGLSAELECFQMCSQSWSHYLQSLRQLLETGQGMPRGSRADLSRRQSAAS